MPEPAPAPEVKHLWAELETDGPQVGILMGSESDSQKKMTRLNLRILRP